MKNIIQLKNQYLVCFNAPTNEFGDLDDVVYAISLENALEVLSSIYSKDDLKKLTSIKLIENEH